METAEVLSSLHQSLLGYGAVHLCVGLALLALRRAADGDAGIGYWGVAFLLNSAGFLFWVATSGVHPMLFFVLGDAMHMAGVVILVLGVYRFTGKNFAPWNLVAVAGVGVVWAGAMGLMLLGFPGWFAINSLVRATLFLTAGRMILRSVPAKSLVGRSLAGWGMVAWGGCVVLFPLYLRIPSVSGLGLGFLVGFHLFAALGMVILIVGRMRLRAERIATRAERLEGLLPICSYCKRIRDENGHWQSIESYFSERSDAGFSHGLCPECASRHFPDFVLFDRHR